MRKKLLQRTAKTGGLLYVAEMHGGSVHHKMDHLVCFLPGAPSFMHTPCAKALHIGCTPDSLCITTAACGRAMNPCVQPKIQWFNVEDSSRGQHTHRVLCLVRGLHTVVYTHESKCVGFILEEGFLWVSAEACAVCWASWSCSAGIAAGLLALGHMHGVNTGKSGQPDDLAVARELMRTCYEMYARTPTGLAPEIVHFVQRDGGSEFPKQHDKDVGGGDFTVTAQV